MQATARSGTESGAGAVVRGTGCVPGVGVHSANIVLNEKSAAHSCMQP